MKDPQPEHARSAVSRLSRSAVGRVSGAMSRMFESASHLKATARFLRRQLWAWPIVAAVLFGGAGWRVYPTLENPLPPQRATHLNAIVYTTLPPPPVSTP